MARAWVSSKLLARRKYCQVAQKSEARDVENHGEPVRERLIGTAAFVSPSVDIDAPASRAFDPD